MAMATAVPHYTADEVRQFDDPRLRFEVIRGELFVSPAPGLPHQLLVVELIRLLSDYLDQHHLGFVLPGPFEVQLADDSAVQPDVLVILSDRGPQPTRERLHGPPALVIEIISYSSKRTDRLQKRQLYLEEGVSEYWVVDPVSKQLERWRPESDRAEVLTTQVSWKPTPDAPALVVDLAGLFARSEVR